MHPHFIKQFTGRAVLCLPPGWYGNMVIKINRGRSQPNYASWVGPDRGDGATFTFTITYVVVVLIWRKVVARLERIRFYRYHTKWLLSILANRLAQLWRIFEWTDQLRTISQDHRKRVCDIWKSACRVCLYRKKWSSNNRSRLRDKIPIIPRRTEQTDFFFLLLFVALSLFPLCSHSWTKGRKSDFGKKIEARLLCLSGDENNDRQWKWKKWILLTSAQIALIFITHCTFSRSGWYLKNISPPFSER